LKAFLEIGGAGLTLLGVVVSVYGTFVLTQWTHTYSLVDFLKSTVKMFFRKAKRQERINQVATALTEGKDEEKAKSLAGLQWVFLGFVLQAFGSILLTIDAVWVNFFVETTQKAGQ
jgi:hypothetical protein